LKDEGPGSTDINRHFNTTPLDNGAED